MIDGLCQLVVSDKDIPGCEKRALAALHHL